MLYEDMLGGYKTVKQIFRKTNQCQLRENKRKQVRQYSGKSTIFFKELQIFSNILSKS